MFAAAFEQRATPSVKACGFATFPKGTAEPSQAHCVRQLPRRGSFKHLPVSSKKLPFSGELASSKAR